MALLVTGAMGHVGYATARAAVEQGLQVVGQYLNTFDEPAARALGPGVTWVRCDLADAFEAGALASSHEIDGCIHSAAIPNDKLARPIPLKAFHANVLSTAHLLELARRGSWRRFLLVSTGAVFQRWTDTTQPIAEDEPASPVTVYGTTKHCAELLTATYGEVYGLSTATVRISWVYGPPLVPRTFEGPRGPIPEFLRRVLQGERVSEPSGGDFAASFTHVDDVARGLIAAYRADRLAHHVYHLGSGENYPTFRVVDAIRAAVPRAEIAVGAGTKPWTDFGVLRGPLKCDRMRADFGFAPGYSLESGIAQFAAWIAGNRRVLE
jgi:UDP-glucuronate 4-epimerase